MRGLLAHPLARHRRAPENRAFRWRAMANPLEMNSMRMFLILITLSVLCGKAFADEPGRTSLANPAIHYTVPDKPYVVLHRGEVDAVVVDNRAVDDGVLSGHRAGYSGLASLRHSRRRENLFVPAYAGLNFEHIHDGTNQPWEIIFEPRKAPMQLRQVDDHTAELYQMPTPHWGLESCLHYELLSDGAIEMTVECIPAPAELPQRLHRPLLGELH